MGKPERQMQPKWQISEKELDTKSAENDAAESVANTTSEETEGSTVELSENSAEISDENLDTESAKNETEADGNSDSTYEAVETEEPDVEFEVTDPDNPIIEPLTESSEKDMEKPEEKTGENPEEKPAESTPPKEDEKDTGDVHFDDSAEESPLVSGNMLVMSMPLLEWMHFLDALQNIQKWLFPRFVPKDCLTTKQRRAFVDSIEDILMRTKNTANSHPNWYVGKSATIELHRDVIKDVVNKLLQDKEEKAYVHGVQHFLRLAKQGMKNIG